MVCQKQKKYGINNTSLKMTSRTENPLSRSLEKKTKKKRQLLWSYIFDKYR